VYSLPRFAGVVSTEPNFLSEEGKLCKVGPRYVGRGVGVVISL
jgi:hypothetical protein